MLDVAIIFSTCLANWHAARPTDSCQFNQSLSDLMESACRHFLPFSLLLCSLSLSRTDTRQIRWNFATATRLHRIRWSPFADIFLPLLRNSTLLYIYYVSRKLTWGQSDGLLPRQPAPLRSDGVRLPTFPSHSSRTLLCCVFTKSIANWHTTSPMDSCLGNPPPSDPMESVCRHFPVTPQELYFAVYLLSLSQTDMWPVQWTLATSNRHHRIRWSPFADFSHPFHHSTLPYIF